MAWIEQTETRSWRVRYLRQPDHYGTISGFTSHTTARAYAQDIESDQRRGTWYDPAAARTLVTDWADKWIDSLDVETRTEENYRALLRNHILPHWGYTPLGDITTLDITTWLKRLRTRYAISTVNGILTVFAMLLDDAVDQRLIPANPVRRRPKRGRRRDHAPSRVEKVFAMPEHILRIADQATALGGPSAGLLVITAAWTGCRWGELAGLQADRIDLRRGTITIDPEDGCLHESSGHGLWLGPPKTPASARTITLPPFLVELLRDHLTSLSGSFVFTSSTGCRLRRSDFDRRVFRPAVDGDDRHAMRAIRPGLTFHGLRHSHKTRLIADHVPEITQARRLGHHLNNRLVEVYSHVAPDIETALLHGLEQRWRHAHRATADRSTIDPAAGQGAMHTTASPRCAPRDRTINAQLNRRSAPCPAQIQTQIGNPGFS